MDILLRLRRAALCLVAALSMAAVLPAAAQSLAAAKAPALKAAIVESLKLPADAAATPVRMDPVDPAAVDTMKKANGKAIEKRLQIGIGRDVPEAANVHSSALQWAAVEGGYAARWSVTSAGAKSIRVGLAAKRTAPGLELRFSSPTQPDVVYGPFTEADLNVVAGRIFWSPVLDGDTAIVEVFVRGDEAASKLSIDVAQVSHLIASPADPHLDSALKTDNIGASGFCEVNLICRSASDSALASTGEAVARMLFVENGASFLCTGTLLNSSDARFTPYFYTAAHCISDQVTASTLITWWVFESTTCGGNSLNPNNTQTPGGATLLYANADSDISFMRLNKSPPPSATFAGWDASTLSGPSAFTAVHHPAGDLKKVSLGSFAGFVTAPPIENNPQGSFIKSIWNSVSTGVTEGGSSGSGIFTQSGGGYAFRGGLLGGPSSCTASSSDLYDYYSRFDVAYPNIAQYLSAAAPTNYTALWWNAPANSESGWGINITQQGDILFATLFTYDNNGNPLWLVMSSGARQGTGDTFSGALYRTTGSPFSGQFNSASTTVTQVGTMTLSFSGADTGSLSYSVNGVSVNKSITKQVYAASGAAQCTGTTGSRASAANYTDLWWNAPANSESGWGINLTQQGGIMFATLFVYGGNGQVAWYVMSAGRQQSDGSFTGALYQTVENNGGNFATTPWPGVGVSQVGTMTLRFSDGENGTLVYTVNGTTVTKAITRQVFSSPVPICTG